MNTELRQKLRLPLSIREIHLYMLKKDTTGFPMAYNENFLVLISDSDLQLLLPPQLRKNTQRHQIIFGCKICIQAGKYQESLNHWRKRLLKYIKNHSNSLTMVSVEK